MSSTSTYSTNWFSTFDQSRERNGGSIFVRNRHNGTTLARKESGIIAQKVGLTTRFGNDEIHGFNDLLGRRMEGNQNRMHIWGDGLRDIGCEA